MSNCVTKQQYLEAVRKEEIRLLDYQSQGYDIDEAMATLKANKESFLAGKVEELQTLEQRDTPINQALVSRANREKPMRRKGGSLQRIESIHRLFTDPNGIHKAVVSFPGSQKTYTINATEVSLDQMDLTAEIEREVSVLGSTAGANKVLKKSKYDTYRENIHKDPALVKELLEDIHQLENEKESTEHMEHLREIVDMLNPRFFNKLNIFINEQAKETLGMLDGTDIKLTISQADKLAGNEQTAAETYVHELVHAYTAFATSKSARKQSMEARRMYRELTSIISTAADKLTWKSFMPKESIDKKLEEKNAREMYDYIFKSENYVEEFIAHALTNPVVMEQLKHVKVKEDTAENLLEKIKNFFGTLVDIVLGNYEFKLRDKNVYEATLALTASLGEINNKSIRHAESKMSPIAVLVERFNETEQFLSDQLQTKLQQLTDKYKIPDFPGFENKVAYAAWTVKYIPKLIFDKKLRPVLKSVLASFGMKEEGFFQNVLRDFWDSDELQDEIELLQIGQDHNEAARLSTITAIKANILSEFKNAPTEQQERAITRILMDTDISSIYDKYGNAGIAKLLENDEELERRLSRAKHALRKLDNDNYFWHVNQANGLGYYMATHTGSIAQNLNTVNIARGLLSNHRRRPTKELVAALDEVATLSAIKYSSKKDRAITAKLMREDLKGIRNIVNTQAEFKKVSKDKVFSDSTTHIIQGYSREIFDDRISIEVAKVSDKMAMKARGYILVEEFDEDPKFKTEPMGLYRATTFETREYYRSAVSLTNLNRKGTTLNEVRFKEGDTLARRRAMIDKQRIDTERRKLVNQMQQGEVELGNLRTGMIPLLNEQGNVIDYRYAMSKNGKEKHLNQDTRVSEVLARSVANVHDKVSSREQNEKVLDLIKADMKANFTGTLIGKNGERYIKISPNSSDKTVQEIYKVLPDMFKQAIKDNEGGFLAVRKDMLLNYFGYRHLSISDSFLKNVTPAFVMTAVKWAESFWQELVKISKIDILIRTPSVIIENILSNMFYAIWTGTNPIELIQMYKESTRDIKDYLKNHRELVHLENAKLGRKLTREENVKIEKLRKDLKDNPVAELMESGIYQAIVEDISTAELTSTNRISRFIDEKTQGVPELIKQGGHWLYLSEKTGYYKFMSEVLQLSDLVARDVENKKKIKLEEKQANGQMNLPLWWVAEKYPQKWEDGKSVKMKLTGADRKEFMEKAAKRRKLHILRAFVNYNKPSTAFEEYLNKMGLVMFTKYAKRIQNVIANTTIDHPLRAVLLIMFQALLIDVETIQDQQLLVRSYASLDQDMLDHIERVFAPTMVQFANDGIL